MVQMCDKQSYQNPPPFNKSQIFYQKIIRTVAITLIIICIFISLCLISSGSAYTDTNISIISKGETYIHWQWNKTDVNYTMLDGELKPLRNGTYIYSNLQPNSTHILGISWDGINETVSIVKTDNEYNYFKWFFIMIGLIAVIISMKIAIFSIISFVIFMFNLAYNFMGYTRMELIICILLLIVSLILIDFNYGGK